MESVPDLIAPFLALYGFISLVEDIEAIVKSRQQRHDHKWRVKPWPNLGIG